MDPPRPRGRFTASQRVRKRSEFLEIQSRARRVSTPHFILLVRAREESATGARLGLTVSRRVGCAVRRNRIKRLLREAFRATKDLWPSDVDLVVIVKPSIPNLGLDDVASELLQVGRSLHRRIQDARRDRDKQRSDLAPRG